MAAAPVFALFAALFGTAYALKCYAGETNGYDKPTYQMDCAPYLSKYCIKALANGGNGVYEAAYGCAQRLQCTAPGCSNVVDGTKCCCATDYCNSSSKFSLIATMIFIAFTRLINVF